MSRRKIRGFLHLTVMGFLFCLCLVILVMSTQSHWPLDRLSTTLLLGALFSVGLLLSWRGVANLRASEDLYLLSLIRKMGGRITAAALAQRAERNVNRINQFLEAKVQRGQAVTQRDDEEVVYIFDGFRDETGKNLQFRL